MNNKTKQKLAHKHQLGLRDEQLSYVKFIYCDDEKNSLQNDGTIAVFNNPIYIAPGIRLCPLYPSVGVDESGNIYNSETLILYSVHYSGADDYPYVYLGGGQKIRNHRATASAWCENSDPIRKHYVNHKDGVKTNFHSSNLEFVTQKENVEHAFMTGLMTVNEPCQYRDIVTGEVRSFSSVSEAAKYLGVTSSIIHYYIRDNAGDCLLKKRYEFKYTSDLSDWINPVIGKIKPSSKYNIYVTSPNGETETFWNLAAFDEKFNGYNCMRNIDIVIRKASKRHPDLKFDYDLRYPNTTFEIKSKETGDITETSNIDEIVSVTGRSRTYVMGLLGTDRVTEGISDYIRVKTNSPWKDPECIGKREVIIRAKNLSSGVIETFYSIKSLAEEIDYATATIRNRLREGTPYNGFSFELVSEVRK